MKGKTRVPKLTLERVREVLDYNPENGVFVWKVSTSKNVRVGMIAGGSRGYIAIDGESVTISRLVLFYVTGTWPERRVRFKNKDKKDFRFCNLTQFNGIGGEFDHKSEKGRAEYLRAYRRLAPKVFREAYLKNRFGISLAEYGDMLLKQNGVCAICLEPERQKRNGKMKALAVDHDHESGNVRGLLCNDCNTGIGKLKDRRDVLLSAVRYLDKHSGENQNVSWIKRAGEK